MNNSITRYNANGAPQGQRNAALFAAACQARDEGAGMQEAVAMLEGRAMADGLGQQEIQTTIASAFKGAAREPARKSETTRSLNYTRKAAPVQEVVLPQAMTDPTRRMLAAAFEKGENICLVKAVHGADGKSRPDSKQTVLPLEKWLKLLDDAGGEWEQVMPAEQGAFACINPLVDSAGGRKANNVKLRHCLIEFDGGELVDQWELFCRSHLPITAVIYSGGKSLHAWVRVDAQTQEEYQQRTAAAFEWFKANSKRAELDEKTTDAPRLSRLAGALREGVRQDLLALEVGCKDWLEWEVWKKNNELPEPADLREMLAFDPEKDPDNLVGNRWLCRGGSVLWVGESGVGKSVLTTQAALCWATGQPLFGVKPVRPLRSLIIQAENSFGDLAEGFRGILAAFPERRQLAMADALKSNLLFVSNSTWTGKEFVESCGRLIERHKPDLVWIDPLLSFMGCDPNSNSEVGRFLRNWINPVAETTGCAFMLIHHTGKPPRDPQKQSRSAMSYAGLGASELVNWARAVVVLQSNPEGGFQLHFTKRGKRAGVDTVPVKHSTKAICWERDTGAMPQVTFKPKQ